MKVYPQKCWSLRNGLRRPLGKVTQGCFANVFSDMQALMSQEFKGITGEKCSMNVFAPEVHQDNIAQSQEGRLEFIKMLKRKFRSIESQVSRVQSHYLVHRRFVRKSANRGNYNFRITPVCSRYPQLHVECLVGAC